jgi:hypothetical protein
MDEVDLNIVRETFGKVVYTHKTYEKAADISTSWSKGIKLANIILLVLTTGTALGSLLSSKDYSLCTSVLSTITLFFVTIQFNFNFEANTTEYKNTAKKLWYIREKYQNFIADIQNERYNPEEIVIKRDSLLEELNQTYENALSTNRKAYKIAQKALKVDEEMTFSDKEIDMFLPTALRKNK